MQVHKFLGRVFRNLVKILQKSDIESIERLEYFEYRGYTAKKQ